MRIWAFLLLATIINPKKPNCKKVCQKFLQAKKENTRNAWNFVDFRKNFML